MKEAKKTNLQIRGIAPELVAKVRLRANTKSQTMSQYLIDLIQRWIEEQEKAEKWLDEVRTWEPIPVRGGMTGAQAVREAREERVRHLARNAMQRRRSRSA
jgi:hypothetical protein